MSGCRCRSRSSRPASLSKASMPMLRGLPSWRAGARRTTTGPFRAELERSGLTAGTDFDLAFAPERVNPGDPASASKGVPRLIGATTATATSRAAALLRLINDEVLELSSPDAAELAKLL